MKQICITYTPASTLESTLQLPSSKSIANRALIIQALMGRTDLVQNIADCDDTKAVKNALKCSCTIKDIGAAGTAMRFLTALYAQTPGEWIMTGTERMKHRPISILVNALRELGAEIKYMGEEGYPPLYIAGKKMQGGAISLDGSVSSQFISALLMIAPVMKQGLELTLTGQVVSTPYIQMTLDLMHYFGIEFHWHGSTIHIAPQTYQPQKFVVENDWSAASYWYAVAAIHGNARFHLPHLFDPSLQGDAALSSLFLPLGVRTQFTESGVLISTYSVPSIGRYVLDLEKQPDLAQTLVVVCLMKNLPFEFSGLGNLKIKETDRMAALITESRKLGYVLQEKAPGVLSWEGERTVSDEGGKNEGADASTVSIDTYEDHRMAMAFAPAALRLGQLKINHPEVVSKSYPSFWEELEKLAGVSLIRE